MREIYSCEGGPCFRELRGPSVGPERSRPLLHKAWGVAGSPFARERKENLALEALEKPCRWWSLSREKPRGGAPPSARKASKGRHFTPNSQ